MTPNPHDLIKSVPIWYGNLILEPYQEHHSREIILSCSHVRDSTNDNILSQIADAGLYVDVDYSYHSTTKPRLLVMFIGAELGLLEEMIQKVEKIGLTTQEYEFYNFSSTAPLHTSKSPLKLTVSVMDNKTKFTVSEGAWITSFASSLDIAGYTKPVGV